MVRIVNVRQSDISKYRPYDEVRESHFIISRLAGQRIARNINVRESHINNVAMDAHRVIKISPLGGCANKPFLAILNKDNGRSLITLFFIPMGDG